MHFLNVLVLAAITLLGLVRADDIFYGLNYGINRDACPTVDDLTRDFTAIKQYTNRVRTFSLSVCNQAELALQASQALGMRIYLGMWIDRPDTFDLEMNALLKLVNNSTMSNVDAIIVGSEVTYRKDTDPDTLAGYIKHVKDIVRSANIQVTTADVYYDLPPQVIDQVDFVMMNAFPYWEGADVNASADQLMSHLDVVVSIAKGKPVRISETGWPSEGPPFGASVASPENQRLYLEHVLCKVRQRDVDMLWFSAIDEPYKQGVEAHWGIMDANRTLKTSLSENNLKSLSCST